MGMFHLYLHLRSAVLSKKIFHLQGQKGQNVPCAARIEGSAEPQEEHSPPKQERPRTQMENVLPALRPSNLSLQLAFSIILSDTQSPLENKSESYFIHMQ